MYRIVIISSFLLAVPSQARAECAAKPELRTYYKPDKLPDKVTTRCTVKNGKCVAVELKGWLYTPRPKVKPTGTVATTKPVLAVSDRPPLLVFNHGSEQ